MDYYDEQDNAWDKLRDDPKWQSERDKLRGMLDYQLSYKSLEKGVQELLEAHANTEGGNNGE